MPIEIKVAPPGITISQGRTFMVTDQGGEIQPQSEQGVYAMDTRFLNSYRLYLNHQPWQLVTSSQLSFYAARIHLTNPPISTQQGELEAHSLGLTISRTVGEGIHEDFELVNYTRRNISVVLELELGSDFADLFEAKAKRVLQRGRLETQWQEQQGQLRTVYTHQDFHRALTYQILDLRTPLGYANGRIFLQIDLKAGQQWNNCGEILLEYGQSIKRPIYTCGGQRATAAPGAASSAEEAKLGDFFDDRQARWRDRCTDLLTPNDHVYRMYHQAIEDMGALRIYDLDVSDEAWVPAAGVPWFVTLFGRDSLMVSLQNMSVSPGFAYGALKRLADYQAQERDDRRDAQPGKILHEIRFGELAHFHTIPHTPYYGTADATLLYLIVLSETYRWTGHVGLLQEYRHVAQACLNWIDQYGDLDGDGFQEYQTCSPLGYENMGWKDSGDAVVYADGSQVKQPKGLCELQGYVYKAESAHEDCPDSPLLGKNAPSRIWRHRSGGEFPYRATRRIGV
jgi:glycogen debranching enzyme